MKFFLGIVWKDDRVMEVSSEILVLLSLIYQRSTICGQYYENDIRYLFQCYFSEDGCAI